ncbi:MAG: hypothetical protein COY09_02795 [Candidatus Portnoybacteria bacterium CG_4_10_14_0_2_um_filter_39_11]|uniref:Solute-binding protein family 5 domain-containing protein n=1 Tax=Candidatus Portnoybacteria bacterium CG_4_10_14_0_2_um_filter_39_11 TaxID=1974797 RepID=A0A2M7UH21_9BACT|nr:MAG: hypothetical protein AUJ33_02970 [Parcubacteria group bacterium CG1_02_40_25]PIZ70511.1 MAG: hypothetical protein COY09_02795 [Candidatus Portnoybacteria bacterium CG_4_10_14_0_2_um_filter_39_11]
MFIAAFSWLIIGYQQKTQATASSGGIYPEGLIGQPRYINPLFSSYNDPDRDLTSLIFSGLLKYDCQGELVPDLAEKYTVSQDGKTYDVIIKNDIKWSDGEELNADDIIYTIQTAQDPSFNSPLQPNWQGVNVEKIDQYNIRFTLKTPYAPFLHHLTTGILPRHIWQSIDATNFPLAQHHLSPISSGPYRFKKLQKDADGNIRYLELTLFKDYFGPKPNIETLAFRFYPNQDDAIAGLNKGEVDGLSYITAQNKNKIQDIADVDLTSIQLPRYFAIFFNQSQNKALATKEVRQALNLTTDKKAIVDDLLNGQGQIINSPLDFNFPLKVAPIVNTDVNPSQAQEILDKAGWKQPPDEQSPVKNDQGITIRQKTIGRDAAPTLLEIDLVTTDWPELSDVGQLVKKQWEQIGAKINLQIVELAAIQQDFIKSRNYQALLFGEILSADPDPFAFWHSSQKKDPGLNLALYDNPKTDKLLEEARQESNSDIRTQKYQEFQKILTDDLPAIFLYNPVYLYPVSHKLKGVNITRIYLPNQRFCQIEDWYLKTKRIPK